MQQDVYASHERREYVRHLSQRTGDQMLVQLMPGKAREAGNHCLVCWWVHEAALADWDWTSRPGCFHCLRQRRSLTCLPMRALGYSSHSCLCPDFCCRNSTKSCCFLPRTWRHGAKQKMPSPDKINIHITHNDDRAKYPHGYCTWTINSSFRSWPRCQFLWRWPRRPWPWQVHWQFFGITFKCKKDNKINNSYNKLIIIYV